MFAKKRNHLFSLLAAGTALFLVPLCLLRAASIERISVATRPADAAPVSFTPADFGALGDGVHDDAPAIQAALNSGYPVRFEPKKYLLETGVAVSRQTGLHIDFSGATLVKANNENYILRVADSADIVVQGGLLTCQTMPVAYSKSPDAHAIMIVRSTNVTLRNLHINGSAQMGVSIMECDGILAENNFIENCYRDGIYSHYTVNVRYLDNRLRHIKDDALSYHDYGLPEVKARMKARTGYEQGGRVIISGNLISNAIQGIASIGCDQVTISNNVIEDTVNAGICVFNSDRLGLPGGGKPGDPVLAASQVRNVVIAGNQITRAALDGTRILDRTYKNGLPGCTARAAICAQSQGYDHMYQTSTRRLSNIVITGNLVSESGTEGIFANKVDRLIMLGNTIIDCNVNNSGATPDMIHVVESTQLHLAANSIIDTRSTPLHVRGIHLEDSAGRVDDNYIQGFKTLPTEYTRSNVQRN
ncbi:MAG: right-handed parallel beta-helix repeat-containing protein [Opitutaceae bacterium]|jgi:nitrous oxidase accessory protein NosD|nr:right-handed parallel beta-helix repeat-containing protein [Opitutaceae bacterium]